MNKMYKIIQENLFECVTNPIILEDTRFHHELDAKKLPDVIMHGGLLSNRLRTKIVESRELTEKELKALSDEHYVNGMDNISLSSMEEDFSQMYRDERIYPTYNTIFPDIIVSSNVKAFRNTNNYFNEFLVSDKIPVELFNSINFRLLKIYNYKFYNDARNTDEYKIKLMKEHYEKLREIALLIKEYNLNIPLREVSEVSKPEEENTKSLTLNIDKVINLPRL